MKVTTFRRIIQGTTFGLFVLLIFFTTYPFSEKIPVDFFLRLDPLVALVAMIGSRAVIVTMLWAAVLLCATLIIGRFFCGYVCPLGTLIDMVNAVFYKKHSIREKKEPKPNRNIKYFVLIGVLTGSLLGANVLHFLSPMSILPRTFALIINPMVISFLDFLLDISRPLTSAMGLDAVAQFSFHPVHFTTTMLTLLLITGIIVSNFWRKRFWCRYICPTGALLSLFSRFGIVKRKIIAGTCTTCYRCSMVCNMRAIDNEPQKTVLSECTLCGNCVDVCPQDKCSSLGIASFGFSGNNGALLVERRHFMNASLAGIIAASTIKASTLNKKNTYGKLIRPPGAIPENDFLARCIRCGDCMKTCKTNALHPTDLEAGFDAIWTPRLLPRTGACEEKCNMCGHVCPTQAIRALPLKEKQFVKIGTAVIDRHRCIAWEQNKLCLICDEICPYDAIEFRIVETVTGPFKVPIVFEDKCVGCGWCEHKCPVAGQAAIEVYSIGEERFTKGSYITEQKKKMREITDTHESSYDVNALGSGGETGGTAAPTTTPVDTSTAPVEEGLPGGFILE